MSLTNEFSLPMYQMLVATCPNGWVNGVYYRHPLSSRDKPLLWGAVKSQSLAAKQLVILHQEECLRCQESDDAPELAFKT